MALVENRGHVKASLDHPLLLRARVSWHTVENLLGVHVVDSIHSLFFSSLILLPSHDHAHRIARGHWIRCEAPLPTISCNQSIESP